MSDKTPLKPCFCKDCTRGRIHVHLAISAIGHDLLVTVLGGSQHIGAVAVAEQGHVFLRQCEGHREGEIARDMALTLAQASARTVCVVCGIHYDHITRTEIDQVLAMCKELEAFARDALQTLPHQSFR